MKVSLTIKLSNSPIPAATIQDANNRAVEHEMLGDDVNAERLFAVALSLLPLCNQEMQFHAKQMNAAYQSVLSRKHNGGHSSIWSLIRE